MVKYKHKIICIIPARGGSRGLPGKNIKLLAGKPLIAHTIEQARKVGLIDRVIVSTDNNRIARIARKFGAEVPFRRPKELAQDFTSDLPVFKHALKWLAEKEKFYPDFIVHLRCTCPLRNVHDIQKAIKIMIRYKPDSVISVSLVKEPPQKMWRINKKGRLIRLLPASFNIAGGSESPRQLLEPIYRQNGIVDVARYETILEKKSMFGEKALPLITGRNDAWDIDTPLDLFILKTFIKNRNRFKSFI